MPVKFKHVYQFKITLKEIKPPIWRRIQVPETYTFWDLHVAITDSMGWLDYHLHQFTIKNPVILIKERIGIPLEDGFDDDDMVFPGWATKIAPYFTTENPKADYLYDFGDYWMHTVRLEGIFPRDKTTDYPLCLKGKRAAPPEDCGGIPGYESIINGDEETVRAYHDFDPESFSIFQVIFDDPEQRWARAFSNSSPDDDYDNESDIEDTYMPNKETLRVIDEIKRTLAGYSGDTLSIVQIHGMLSAVVCGPVPVLPDVWLPQVFLQKELPHFASAEEISRLAGPLINLNNTISNSLEQETFMPYVGEEDLLTVNSPAEWCRGFKIGMSFAEELWNGNTEKDFQNFLLPFFYPLHPEHYTHLTENLSPEEKECFEDNTVMVLPDAVKWLQNYWRGNPPQTVPPGPPSDPKKQQPHLRLVKKVGRNEPCPCGSGKKYKKCCGK